MSININNLTAWLIPKVKDGLTDEQIWIDYLADENINNSSRAESSVKRQSRQVREILLKAELLIQEDGENATVLLSQTESGNDLEIAIRSYSIKDVNGLREWANLSTNEWECYGQTVRASQNFKTPWFIVEGKFKKRDPRELTIEEISDKLENLIKNYVPKKISVPKLKKGQYLLEISLPDLHLGNRSYDNKDSLELCSKRFTDAVSYFIQETEHKELDEIIITFGNDYFTINADKPETAKGTPQETSDFYDKIYEIGLQTAVDTVNYLRGHARKVRVVGVLANHDPQSSMWLMLALNQIFKNVDGIYVDYKYAIRKYHRFGVTAFTFVHKLEKNLKTLPLLMYQEMIENNLIDPSVIYYEIHGGHLHQPGKYNMPAESTNQKITQRILSSLSSSARYSKDQYGEHTSEGQAFLYDFHEGIKNCLIYRPK